MTGFKDAIKQLRDKIYTLVIIILVACIIFIFVNPKKVYAGNNNIKEGDAITFGKYEQDNDISNGCEPIEWIVLEIKEEKALLLSKYALDNKPYCEWDTLRKNVNENSYSPEYSLVDISSWKDCTLRK